MATNTEDYRSYISRKHEACLTLTEGLFESNNYSLHDSIPHAIMNHLEEGDNDLKSIFPIEKPCRILPEGYQFDNGVVAEDFAISGSYEGGEMVIGQIVSCNMKDCYGGQPRDVIQAKYFEQRLRTDHSIHPTIKSVYTVRTKIPEEEVSEAEKAIRDILEKEGFYDLDIEIFEVNIPDDLAWEKALDTISS